MQVLRYGTLTVVHHIIIPESCFPTSDVDANRNPHLVTKERIERAAAENQFIKGKLGAIEVRMSFYVSRVRIDGCVVVSRLAWFSVEG